MRSYLRGRGARIRANVDAGTLLQERTGDGELLALGGVEERSATALVVLNVDTGARQQQQLHEVALQLQHRHVQRRVACM